MEIEDLKHLCISNLILVILNKNNTDTLRKYAEIELRKRIRNFGCDYDDFLHIDDKVIKERGLNINNYLISPNVDMQQLMETYFLYAKDTHYYTNGLLFSEKLLCNKLDFGMPFFRKICDCEIKNIDKRLKKVELESQKQLLLSIKSMLEKRQHNAKQTIIEVKESTLPFDVLCASDAMQELEAISLCSCLEFLCNISDEERYKLISSKLGMMKIAILERLNDTLFDPDLMQNLYGLMFATIDSFKLNRQKRKLLEQVRDGYKVDYESPRMQYALQKIKK